MTEDSFTINTYRTDTDEKIDDTFKIVKTDKPSRVIINKLSADGKKAVVKYKKAEDSVTGYQIVYADNSSFNSSKKITTQDTSAVIKKLTQGKTYYVKVCAYKKVEGKTIYGAYSTVKKIKISK